MYVRILLCRAAINKVESWYTTPCEIFVSCDPLRPLAAHFLCYPTKGSGPYLHYSVDNLSLSFIHHSILAQTADMQSA